MRKYFLVLCLFSIFFGLIYGKQKYSFFPSSPMTQSNNLKTHLNREKAADFDCSDGWRVTGYFTPIETDYDSTETREIEIRGFGKMSFNADFLNVVFDEDAGYGEGWGKTRFGWYLGNYNGAWHKADAPLDANNTALKTNSVAVDNAIIPYDSTVKIPGLPGEFGAEDFIANDVGVTVHGKHIDIYTGEGKEAEREMYRVTFKDEDNLQQVCFKTP